MILTNIFGQNIKESKLCQSFIIIKDPTSYIASLLSHYWKNHIGQFWNDVICEQPQIDKAIDIIIEVHRYISGGEWVLSVIW